MEDVEVKKPTYYYIVGDDFANKATNERLAGFLDIRLAELLLV